MKFQFNPATPAPNNSLNTIRGLNFQATDVTVQSGPNFVTIMPAGIIVPPGIVNFVYTFQPATAIATFSLMAPPPGQVPIGPPQVLQTVLIYSDQNLPAQPGQSIAPPAQPVSLIQGVSVTGGGVESFFFATGLARAVTFFCIGPNSTNWFLFGSLFTAQTAQIQAFTGITSFEGSAGQGTQGIPGAGLTCHMFSAFTIESQDAGNHFVIDGRLYY